MASQWTKNEPAVDLPAASHPNPQITEFGQVKPAAGAGSALPSAVSQVGLLPGPSFDLHSDQRAFYNLGSFVPRPPELSPTSPLSHASSSTPSIVLDGGWHLVAPWKPKYVLCIDGGGIQAISSLIVLREIMREVEILETLPGADRQIQRRHGQTVDQVIGELEHHHIDLPVLPDDDGPLLSLPKPHRHAWPYGRASALFDMFSRYSITRSARAFTISSTTSVRGGSAPSTEVSATASEFQADLFKCQVIAWAWAAEVEGKKEQDPFPFCTFRYETPDQNGRMTSIPEVAKAVTTPRNCKPFIIREAKYVDGSRLIRDPSLETMRMLSSMFESENGTPSIGLLLSLGTKEPEHPWWYEKLRKHLPGIASKSPADISRAMAFEQGRSYHYYIRFEVPYIKLTRRHKKDAPALISEIESATMAWLDSDPAHRANVRTCARFLVETRRQRSQTENWERYALGVRYVCEEHVCKYGPDRNRSRLFDTRQQFFKHLDQRHQLTSRAALHGEHAADYIRGELDNGRRFGCS
ncbi:uncharacterized protein CTHT_0043650 [Thermochaetoides thermophila DSM 1495]|uniref:PNPLA domain-containing protein n=1 Tax=Chaetomium thermophilum (strain DSM 1495 / CBS 144.50 / IMI 039719) TaxID=759272 RepID=G0S8W3_CHATD|nr:hypothetical protein CTHT_0043650 [Thermochaetoides thermophila DSM 1495]EGS19874.1 hypothetical protein CTHT_0043650 [Thermochaetoides thermophila DSM 1495]